MGITNFPGGLSSMGIPVLGGGGIPAMFGNVYFVDYRNGSDGNIGKDKRKAFKTWSKAYDAADSNNNDVILIDGDSEILEDTKITWAKNRIHTVGLGGGFLTGQRSRISNSTDGITEAVNSTLEVSGVGNTFSNLKISNINTNAASIACMIDSGEANVFNNCSYMKFSDLNVAAVADVICRSDSTTYMNCEIGFDTLVQSAARATFWLKNSGGTRAKHLKMYNCHFVCSSSAATKSHILVANTSSLAFHNLFENCRFLNSLVGSLSAAALNDAITSVSGLLEGNMLFINPVTDALELCSAVTDQVKVQGPGMSLDGGTTAVGETLGIAITPA